MPDRRWMALAAVTLIAIGLQFHRAFVWLVGTFSNAELDSWGIVPLLLIAWQLRRLPARRTTVTARRLLPLLLVALVDLALASLQLQIISAAFGIVALHLWAVTFFAYRGRWYLQPQLWLGLLSLPLVYWINTFFGFGLQVWVTRAAGGILSLYGQHVVVDGVLLRFPSTVVAVDTVCSGVKLLYSGILFGIVAFASAPAGWRRLVLWAALVASLLGANVLRVVSLAQAHLRLGGEVSQLVHEGIGLVAFLLACGATLALMRWIGRGPRSASSPAPHETCLRAPSVALVPPRRCAR